MSLPDFVEVLLNEAQSMFDKDPNKSNIIFAVLADEEKVDYSALALVCGRMASNNKLAQSVSSHFSLCIEG